MSARLPVRRVEGSELGGAKALESWAGGLPAIAAVLRDGLDLAACTVLTGDNGTGKSTVLEAIAEAIGIPGPVGSSRSTGRRPTGPLAGALRLVRDPGAPRHAALLRAEAPEQRHGTTRLRDETTVGARAHELSHGESFLSALAGHARVPGLYLLDEPESGLSFASCLTLLTLLSDMVATGSQVILVTHSVVLTAAPGARRYEFSDDGIVECDWPELSLVREHRRFLTDPQGYLRHLS